MRLKRWKSSTILETFETLRFFGKKMGFNGEVPDIFKNAKRGWFNLYGVSKYIFA